MTYRDALLADPLFVVLTSRGMSRHEAFDHCERIAIRCESGEPELSAVEAVLGFVPHSIREQLSTPARAPSPDGVNDV